MASVKKPITMQQIADELGVSRLTVSSVINNRSGERGISDATTQRVREHLEQRGYVPSRRALDLRAGARDFVGILHCGALYSHLIEAFNLITRIYNDKPGGMEILVIKRTNLIEGVQELLARGVSRLVWIHTLSPPMEFRSPTIFNYLTHFETVVIYNYHFDESDNSQELTERGFHLVGVDRAEGCRRLAGFLRGLGHRVVALPDLNGHGGQGTLRVEHFTGEGLEIVRALPEGVRRGSPREMGAAFARGTIEAMRERGATCASLFGDEEAGQLLAHLARQGIKVPEELTVVGYDGLPLAEITSPPLTTLSVPVEKMVAGVEKLITGNGDEKRRHCFDLELIERATHAPVRKGGPKWAK